MAEGAETATVDERPAGSAGRHLRSVPAASTGRSPKRVLPVGATVLGAGVAATGLAVAVAWTAGLFGPARPGSGIEPMEYNVALGFTVAGLAVIILAWAERLPPLMAWARRVVPALAAGYLCLVGLLTLAEHVFGIGLGIDRLLMRRPVDPSVVAPGRMAPNAAVAFLVLGAGLGAAVVLRRASKVAILGVLGSLVLGLGVVTEFGYAAGLPPAPRWAPMRGMPLASGITIAAIGTAVVAVALAEGRRRGLPSRWLSVPAGVCVLAFSLFLWQLFVDLQGRRAVSEAASTLVLGVITAVLVAVAVAAIQRARQRAGQLQSLNGQLERAVGEHRLIEDALRASQERYRAVVDAARDVVFGLSTEGTFSSLNPAFEAITGWSAEAWVGRSFAPLIHQDDIAVALEAYARALRGHAPPLFEVRLRTKTGDFIIGEVTAGPLLEDGRVVGVLGVARDITERKRLDEELMESEARFRRLWDAAFDAVVISDMGQIRETNEAFCELVGYEAEELRSMSVADIVHADELADVVERVRSHMEGTYEITIVRKDGQAVQVEASARRLPYGGRTLRVTTMRDISARKRHEEALRRDSEYLMALHETALGLMTRQDPAGVLQAIAARACALVGTEHASVYLATADAERMEVRLGLGAYAQTVGRAMTRGQGLAGKVWETGEPLAADEHDVWEFGTPGFIANTFHAAAAVPLYHETGVIGVLALARVEPHKPFDEPDMVMLSRFAELASIALDNARLHAAAQLELAERKQAEAALRRSEEMYRALARHFPNGAVILFDHDLRYTIADGEGLGAIGFSPLDLEGRTIWEAFPEETARILEPNYRAALQGEASSFEVAYGDRIYDVFTHPVRNDRGEVFAGMVMTQDVTERKHVEEALARQAEELARSNAELERFAYVASHDLQEPLRMVASYSQLLARRYKGQLDEDADEFIGFAVDGATRMQALINDLLAYSRVQRQADRTGPVDCDAIMERALFNLKAAIDERGALITSDPLPTVEADPLQMTQLFQNLIGNGVKFSNGTRPQVHVGAVAQGDQWLFTVRDEGMGIDPQYAERIFAPFQRLHSSAEYPGTGIGLAICKKIVERHGGRIWVESERGAGATFRFTLPVAKAG